MGRVLFAGTATVFFVVAMLAMFIATGGERIAAGLALAGLAALSVSILLHVSDPPRR
jgi:hypothetical protein